VRYKIGDKVKVTKLPVKGHEQGTVTDIKPGMPYPYYLTSPAEGAKPGDMGPYCDDELAAA
jgi:hypothetical protein